MYIYFNQRKNRIKSEIPGKGNGLFYQRTTSTLSENINKRTKIGFTVFSKTALINIIASAINFSKNASPQLYFPPLPCSNQIYNLPVSALKLHSGTIQGQPEESPFNLFAVDLEMNEASEHEKLPN